jgi:mono/diheme cytochrome c family protein
MLNNGFDHIDEIKALKLASLTSANVDIINAGTSRDSCLLNPRQYPSVGAKSFGTCGFSTSADTVTYPLPEPVASREFKLEEKGKMVYYGVCAGCHAYNMRMIGPPVAIIQALYMDNPQGIVDYISSPSKKRDDYPTMPKQDYLSPEIRRAAAEFMLYTDSKGIFRDPALNQQ